MPRALQACHSYTLVKPNSGEKITIKRGNTIDHLSDADRAYLSRKTITPPSVDDSHLPPMRAPIFQEILDDDATGLAQTEPFNLNAGAAPAAQGGQRTEPVQVQVVVSPDAGVTAAAAVADPEPEADEDTADAGDDGDAAGAADSGGEPEAYVDAPTPKAAAKAAPKEKRQSKARKDA